MKPTACCRLIQLGETGRFLIYLWLLLVVTLFFSCKGEKIPPPPDPTYHLNVSPASIQTPAQGSTTNVSIEANAAWNVTLPTGTDWLEVSKTAGDGNDAIQVKVIKENTSAVKRTTAVTIALVNGKAPAKTITVEQDFTVAHPVTVAWKKVLGGNGNDYGYSIIKTSDGGYLLSGRTTSNNSGDVGPTKGGIDMWVMKMDAAGTVSWQKTFGGNADEYSVAAAVTPDGGYVLTGYTTSTNTGDVGQNHGNTDFWVVRVSASGALQWQKTLGGNADDRPFAVTITTEGKIAVAGYTSSNNNGDVGANHGSEDMWVAVLDNSSGSVVWKKTFGGTGTEMAKALAPAPDGGLFVGGTSNSNNNGDVGTSKGSTDMWILRLANDGTINWKTNLGGTNHEELHSIALGANNTLIATGSTKSNNTGDVTATKGGEDIWVVQLNSLSGALGWQKSFGGTGIDVAKGILVRPNGQIILAGYSYSHNSGDVEANHGAGDFWVIGLNNLGSVVWKKLLGGDDEDLASSIADAGDGGFAVSGSTMSTNSGDVGAGRGNSDAWVVKLKE